MQLALSGRLWETPNGPTLTLNEQIQAAAELGYRGFEIRYPLLPKENDWESVRETLQRHNVKLIFSAGAGAPSTPEKQADFIRVLDTVAFLGGEFVKQIPHDDESEFEAMRLAADLGAERGIKVVTQYHSNSLTDTVEKTERFFQTLDHPNLGLIFDACHIPFSDTLSIQEAATRLQPWIDLVNLQSYKPSKENDGLQHAAINGREWSLALPDDAEGTDLVTTVEVLKTQGYSGWWVVMPAIDPSMEPLVVAKAYYDFLLPLI
jgi:sugar phosphate isomerase/epimerase